MSEPQWVPFTGPTRKRRRAELACTLCHSKKIRCDLRARSNQGQSSCTNCLSAEKVCCPRPSKRDKGRLAAQIEGPRPPPRRESGEYDTGFTSLDLTVPQGEPGSRNGTVNRHDSEISPHDQSQTAASLDLNTRTLAQPELPALPSHRDAGARNSLGTVASSGPQDPNTWSANFLPSSLEQSRQGQANAGLLDPPRPDNTASNTTTDRAGNRVLHLASEPGVLLLDLRQSYMETYFEYCYAWCPVLIKSPTLLDDLGESPLLDNALAIVGSHVRPPLIPQPGPGVYYDRARRIFYEDEEQNLITALKAVSLFYWWAPRRPSALHKHSSWWWTCVVIKHAQQAGFHSESTVDTARPSIECCTRRRIWWTAFARERLTAICQGKPCMIDPVDCNIPPPSLQDFPDLEDKSKAEVFINWVQLCAVIGRIAKELSRSANSPSKTSTFPVDLAKELIGWVQSVPRHLQLPIGSNHTPNFNREVHQLHLPYLAVIIVLHLTRSSQSLLQALPPATLAATCIARILKDILVRNEARFLMPITCWYVGMAFIALLQASRSEHLKEGTSADLEILVLAIKQLKNMWATASAFEQTFERLRANNQPLSPDDFPNRHLSNDQSIRVLSSEQELLQSSIDWMDYFPFITAQTSVVAEKLMAQQNMDFIFSDILGDIASDAIPNYQDFMEDLGDWANPSVFL